MPAAHTASYPLLLPQVASYAAIWSRPPHASMVRGSISGAKADVWPAPLAFFAVTRTLWLLLPPSCWHKPRGTTDPSAPLEHAGILLALCLLAVAGAAGAAGPPPPPPPATFIAVGGEGFSGGAATYSSLAVSAAGVPHLAFNDGSAGGRATVMRLSGSSWTALGAAGFSAGEAQYTSLALNADGTPYIAYRDGGAGGRATVMRFDGSSWGTVGLPGFSAGVLLAFTWPSACGPARLTAACSPACCLPVCLLACLPAAACLRGRLH